MIWLNSAVKCGMILSRQLAENGKNYKISLILHKKEFVAIEIKTLDHSDEERRFMYIID